MSVQSHHPQQVWKPASTMTSLTVFRSLTASPRSSAHASSFNRVSIPPGLLDAVNHARLAIYKASTNALPVVSACPYCLYSKQYHVHSSTYPRLYDQSVFQLWCNCHRQPYRCCCTWYQCNASVRCCRFVVCFNISNPISQLLLLLDVSAVIYFGLHVA
jgi:hypothetical protein